MGGEDGFDAFYYATRQDLVLQTFALNGDLAAAHVAVRDAYTAAWHHWRKVCALDDPQDWVRPKAWHRAQRRHNARLWRRNRGLTYSDSAVLDAIRELPMSKRKALLLTHLTGLSSPRAARELGVSRETMERQRRTATAGFAANLDMDPSGAREHLLSLSELARQARLPRAAVIRRAGTRRRRSHTAFAAVGATGIVVASGAVAYQAPSSNPLSSNPLGAAPVEEVAVEDILPSADDLLDEHQITRLGLGLGWRVTGTDDNTKGRGINTTCQQDRFADPNGLTALVRTFRALGGKAERSAVQTIEFSKSTGQAKKAFATTVGWYAGCQVARLQLLKAYQVNHIGDEADMLIVRVWKRPVTTYSIAVARTGRLVTSTVGETVGGKPAPPAEIAQSLADAVSMVCATSGSKDCSESPRFADVPPPPSGEERGVLAVADLPPVGRVHKPWVGTDPGPARVNPSATVCDRADFHGGGASKTRTRTFLVPGAKLPDRFGLSETYGVFGSSRAAGRFLEQVRTRMGGCEDRNPGADVSSSRSVVDPNSRTDSALWDVETETSENESVMFRVGFVRVGHTVAQVNFSPTTRGDMAPEHFEALLVRAGERLRELR